MTYKYRVYLVTGQYIDVTSDKALVLINGKFRRNEPLLFNEAAIPHDKVVAVLTYEEGTDHTPAR